MFWYVAPGPVFANDDDDDDSVDDDDDNDGDVDDDEPVGLAGPVLGKGAVEAEVPVLSPVRVPNLSSFHCDQEDYDYDNDSDDGISAQ